MFDTEIMSPAAGVPFTFSSYRLTITGESGKKQSTRTRSVIIAGYLTSASFGTHELFQIWRKIEKKGRSKSKKRRGGRKKESKKGGRRGEISHKI